MKRRTARRITGATFATLCAIGAALNLAACTVSTPEFRTEDATGPVPETSEIVVYSDDDSSAKMYEVPVTLTDGRTVTCVTFVAYRAGGLSCDFAGVTE